MSRSVIRAAGYALIALALTECSEPTSPTSIPVEARVPQLSLTGDLPYPILVGAGDIGNCTNDNDGSTARLLDAIFVNGQPGSVMMIGDADESVVTDNYPSCYAETWGRHLAITRPAPGNTDYVNGSLDRYFGYFGAAAGEAPGGYYSFDADENWHIIVINSNNNFVPTNADATPQVTWLRNDLRLNTKPCIAAFMHHPRFSSRTGVASTEEGSLRPVWNELYKHGAEFVASGHRHHYERFKPMHADGTLDLALGVIQFIIGTGGVSLGLPQEGVGTIHPNSEVRGIDYGVMKFTLKPDGYDWQFVPARNRFNDAGSANCHPPTIPVALLVSSSSASSVYGQPVTFTAKAEDGTNTVRVGTVSFISGGTCDAPEGVLASDLPLDETGRARATLSTLGVSGSPYSITACYTGAGSYMSSSGSVPHSVTSAAATITLSELTTTYDGQPRSPVATTEPADISVSLTYTDAEGTAVVAPINAGDYTVTATVADPNYSGTASGLFRIEKATPTITWTDPAAIMYGTALGEAQLNATASFSGEPVPGSFTYTPGAGTVLGVGADQILSADFTPADAGNFNGVAGTTVRISVGGTSQTIAFANPGDRTFGDPPFELSATATSGLPVSFAASGSCSISGATVTILAAGSCTFTASQAGDGNIQPADDVVRTIVIAKKTATVTLGSLFHNYDGQPKSASASTDAGGESTFGFTYELNGASVAQPTDPGSYGVVATLINANYQGVASGTLIINAIPVGSADSYSTDEDGLLTVAAPGVMANDSDFEGGALTPSLVSSTTNGALQLNADGSFAYAPNTDFNGTDAFTYRISDGSASSTVVTVTITVNSVNDVPVAVDGSYNTHEDRPLSVNAPGVLSNDTDADVGQTLQAVLETAPAHGTVTLNPDGSFTYASVLDYNGTDSFTYRATDGIATSAPATVTIVIKPVDDPPVGVKVDMVPGSTTNTVALGGTQTQVPFAVLSSSSFDATLIDPARVTVGNAKGVEAPLALNADGSIKFTLVDVSGDGRRDFFAYVNKADLRNNGDLTLTTRSLTVLGALQAPSTVLIKGSDKVNVVP